MSAELIKTLEKVIREVVNNPNLVVKPESRLAEDLGLESIDLLDVSSELENTIGHELDFRDVADFVSKKTGQVANMKILRVQDLVEYIELKK